MMNKQSKFYAYLSRLRWIKRWGLQRNAEPENVMEHSWEVATIAHALALIKNQYYEGNVDANAIATAALYHDMSEVITGDLPTPIKYHSQSITEAYQKIEAEAENELIELLPEALQPLYRECVDLKSQPEINRKIIKAADTLSAHLKCLAEIRSGNPEFEQAAELTRNKIKSYQMEEADHFMECFVPAYQLPIDGLLRKISAFVS
jgi:5'-deoxynucleotidase